MKRVSMMDGVDETRIVGSMRNSHDECVELAHAREIRVPSLEWFRFALLPHLGENHATLVVLMSLSPLNTETWRATW